jgi:hypothetical protein
MTSIFEHVPVKETEPINWSWPHMNARTNRVGQICVGVVIVLSMTHPGRAQVLLSEGSLVPRVQSVDGHVNTGPVEQQSGPTFGDALAALKSRASSGEIVVVRTSGGEHVSGQIASVDENELSLRLGNTVRRFPAADVREIVSGRQTTLWRRGLLIGVGAGLLAGAVDCSNSSPKAWRQQHHSCAGNFAVGAAFGTGLGTLIGSQIKRDRVLYRNDNNAPLAVMTSERPVVQFEQSGARRRAGSLAELGTVVGPMELLYVRTRDGRSGEGHFVRASAEALALSVDGQPLELPAAELRDIKVRNGRMWGRGMLIGGVMGAALGACVASSFAHDDPEQLAVLAGVVVGGLDGMGIGAAVGAFQYHRTVVFDAVPTQISIAPAISPNRIGVQAALRF